MSNRFLYDTAHTVPFQHGPVLSWRDPETLGLMYKRTMRVAATSFSALAIGALGPHGGWLIEESLPSSIGCGLVEWERLYARLPPPRIRGEAYSYAAQQLQDSDIVELTIATTAAVRYQWFHTFDATTIPTLRALRYVKLGETVYTVGEESSVSGQVLAEDSRARHWRGHLYERAAIYVDPVTFTSG